MTCDKMTSATILELSAKYLVMNNRRNVPINKSASNYTKQICCIIDVLFIRYAF